MNKQLILDFLHKIRQNIDVLIMNLSRTDINSEESTKIIRDTRIDMTHLYNLLKAEESLKNIQSLV